MEWLYPYIIAAIAADVLAQGTKVVIAMIQGRMVGWRSFFKSGRMPSAHTATTVALATSIGCIEGFGSAIFAVAATFTVFLAYDAMRVRRAVGEQGEALDVLIAKSGANIDQPYYARGHKPLEVFVGGLVGVSVGLIVAFFATK